jgi:hypothetical protein
VANARNPTSRGKSKQVQLFPRQLFGANYSSDIVSGVEKLEAAVREKVLRSATRAGALIFYYEMQLRVPKNEGTLLYSIYHTHLEKRSTRFRQVYAVGPNKAKAPHWYVVEYGHWRYNKFVNGKPQRSKSNQSRSNRVTPGSNHKAVHDLPGALDVPVWTPASPYIRPTWEAKVGQLLGAFNQRARERLSEVLRGGQ